MAVKHFELDGKIVCNTKAKTIDSTTDQNEVTCKRCLKKLETPLEKNIKKEQKNNKMKFIKHDRFGYCLQIGRNILTLGQNLDDKLGMLKILNELGNTSTSIKLANVTQFLSNKEINLLRDFFALKKAEKGYVLVSDVSASF